MLGSLHVVVWSESKTLPPNFDKYVSSSQVSRKGMTRLSARFLGAMMMITGHPSYLMTSFALGYWTSLYHSRELALVNQDDIAGPVRSSHWFSQQPVFSSVHLQLLQLGADKLMKVGEMQPPEPVVSRYIAIDFDTREGFAQFFGMCKGKVLELTKLLASLQVKTMLNYYSLG